MIGRPDRKLVTEDGQEYAGYGFGASGDRVLETVFNTSMTGYQEILSDPSYADQAVVMTYPLIGNYGIAEDDYESARPAIGALVVRDHEKMPSNFRAAFSLEEVMVRYGIPGISGVDTRKLTRSIRDHGTRRCLITDIAVSAEEAAERIRRAQIPRDAVSRVSCRAPYVRGVAGARYHICAIDCGMKKHIPLSLIERGCRLTVVPWDTGADAILTRGPDGVLISNGPGDPADVPKTVETVKRLLGRVPVFGICLGHQILSLACGAETYKLKFGHRGGNHPVRDTESGRIFVTSQNHSYAVDEGSLGGTGLSVTHVNLLDGTVEGAAGAEGSAFGVQFHPESAPGPQDSAYLFDRFIGLMEERKEHA